MAYTFDQLLAADPANPANVAQNAAITIFAPGDPSMTSLTITDPSGAALANPIIVNANGFGSAFVHETLDRVAWAGGGFTGFLTSYEGMKAEALAARTAAETAGLAGLSHSERPGGFRRRRRCGRYRNRRLNLVTVTVGGAEQRECPCR